MENFDLIKNGNDWKTANLTDQQHGIFESLSLIHAIAPQVARQHLSVFK